MVLLALGVEVVSSRALPLPFIFVVGADAGGADRMAEDGRRGGVVDVGGTRTEVGLGLLDPRRPDLQRRVGYELAPSSARG